MSRGQSAITKRVNEIILGQVIVSFFEFTDLLKIEDMNL